MSKEQYDEIERLIKEKRLEIGSLENDRATLLKASLSFGPGDIVKDRAGEECQVVRARAYYYGDKTPTLTVLKRKKDGAWGQREHSLYGRYTLVTKASAS